MSAPQLPYAVPDKLRDFRSFLCLVWQYLSLPQPTPVQLDIADWLQTGPRRKVLEAFRGVGKSWITSAYVVWRLYLDPQLNFLVVSASKERADSFSTFHAETAQRNPAPRPAHTETKPKMLHDSLRRVPGGTRPRPERQIHRHLRPNDGKPSRRNNRRR